MPELTTALLGRACRTFLSLAYPDGNVPEAKRPYLDVQPGQPIEPLLQPPVCQELPNPTGGVRGYAFRLGCSTFPHLKLQAVDCGAGRWVFNVDTHDAMKLDPGHQDAERWNRMRAANRQLKEQIERAWEQEGLLTANALLREGLEAK